ncbi:glycosyltransferase family 4 protein [Salinirubrum litoreum]|uniref:Glycosyltransferase family 4 protein n=1 Tax=Salinirubrum litoreum TaxID=1126234 RepID=A0ABD5RF29_9EURY
MHYLLLTREFPPNVLGGVAYHSYNLARELTARGHDVTVLTTDTGDYTDTDLDTTEITVDRLDPPTVASPRCWFDRAVRRRLAGSDLLADADVIHSHEYVRFDALDTDTPTILKVHFNLARKFEFFPFETYHPVVRPAVRFAVDHGVEPLERRLASQGLAGADARLFVSRLARDARTDGARPTDGDHVVHNGVDLDRFTPHDTPERDGEYFLFVGGTQRRKGYETLRTAVAGTEIPVRVAGGSPPPDLPPNVTALGHVPQSALPDLYRNARALVHPAHYEPFGNVVLEALACGTPVITTDETACGAAELLHDGVGTTVHPADPEELQLTLQQFDSRAYDSTTCRRLAEAHPWSEVASRTESVAESLVAGDN